MQVPCSHVLSIMKHIGIILDNTSLSWSINVSSLQRSSTQVACEERITPWAPFQNCLEAPWASQGVVSDFEKEASFNLRHGKVSSVLKAHSARVELNMQSMKGGGMKG